MKRMLLVVGLMSLTACGGSGADDASGAEEVGSEASSLSPVAELKLADGHVIGWYEVFKGAVVVGEKFKTSEQQIPVLRTINVQDFSPSGLFLALSEGQELPQALVDLDERVANVAANPEPVPAELKVAKAERLQRAQLAAVDRPDDVRSGRTESGLGISQQKIIDESACPHSWFFSQPVANCDGGESWLVASSLRTGVNNFTHNDNDWVFGGACSYRGAIHHRVRYATWSSWSNYIDVILQTGEGWVWSRSNFALDFDIDVRVDQSDGDGFHVCAAGFD